MSINWPAYYPSDCPPNIAQPPNHTVYRFVRSNPPSSIDFCSNKERFPRKDYGEDDCIACGLSVFTDVNEVKIAQQHIPGMKSKLIAKINLMNDDGLILPSHSSYCDSHHTWWKSPNFNPINRFTIV